MMPLATPLAAPLTAPLGHGIAALAFDPALPPWVLGLLAAVAVLAAAPAVIRRARGWPWRVLALAVLLCWLAGPSLVRETWQNLPDIGILLLDRTASMSVNGRAALASRAAARLNGEAERLPGLELRTIAVPDSPAGGTRLFAALDRALGEVPRGQLAGVIAITDGEVDDVPAVKQSPLAGAPLSVLIPARGEETDRSLQLLAAPSYGIVGQDVTLEAEIEDHGVAHPQSSATLTIRRDGEPPVTESVPVGQPVRIPIPITHAGPTVVALSAGELGGEVSTLNNSAAVTINGVRERLRVLLVSGEPNPGVRAWRRLLKSDPAVDLVHFTILRPPDKEDNTPLNDLALIAFPAHELFVDKLERFDLIIFDQFQDDGLLPPEYLANIANYVRGGGALLVTTGPEFAAPDSLAATPLAAVLPAQPLPGDASQTGDAPPDNAPPGNAPEGVIVGRFVPRVTAIGERHPVTADLPGAAPQGTPSWGPWYRYDAVTQVKGDVLMRTPSGAPLLVLDRVGKGRVAMLLSDQQWLWARGHDGGGPQAELMRRVAHWLMKEPALEANAVTAQIAGGRMSIDRRSLAADAGGNVTVTAPDGKTTTLNLSPTGPGRASGEMPASQPGVWRVGDGTQTAFVAAGAADPLEMSDLRATASRLAPLVRASGGSVHWLAAPGEAGGVPELRRVERGAPAGGSGWIGLTRNHAHLVTGITAVPLLPAWAALPLLVGLMVLAWQREGAELVSRQRRNKNG